VVALFDARNGVSGEIGSGEDVLPGELFDGGGVFALESVGEVDGPKSFEQILIVLGFDCLKVDAKRFAQDVREDGNAVVLAFAIAYDDLSIVEVEVFDAQSQDFHEAKSAAVHKLGHEAVDAVHFRDDPLGLAFGEDGGEAFWFGRADGDQGSLVQLKVEDMPVEKQDGANGLVPLAPPARAGVGGGGNVLFAGKMRDEGINFVHAHVAGMAFLVEEDILAHPGDVGHFGAVGIMAHAQGLLIEVKQFFPWPGSRM